MTSVTRNELLQGPTPLLGRFEDPSGCQAISGAWGWLLSLGLLSILGKIYGSGGVGGGEYYFDLESLVLLIKCSFCYNHAHYTFKF